MRKKHLLILIGIAVCMALSGCNKQTLQEVSDSIIFEEAPEGYVYDYQVSLEPIPKEIADLGGPCQGTIHAFPSRIRIGLTEKMMEEDAELKTEIEKRIPEVEQCLKENIGGEFRVDGVDATDDDDWRFFCTRTDTDYQFSILYMINEYEINGIMFNSNIIYHEHYYDKIDTEEVEHTYEDIINNCFEECVYRVWVHNTGSGGDKTVTINILQFTDDNVEKTEEQIKILHLWRELNKFDSSVWYRINLEYFPTEYSDFMKTKYDEGSFDDLYILYESELLKNGELRAEFSYDHLFDRDNGDSLEDKLNLYDKGKYNEKNIWSYWIVEK